MKHIDNQNYDQWLFRYFEGELSPEEQKQLFTFMERDPALKLDFEAMGNSYIFEPEVTYPKMLDLLVPVSSWSYKHLYIGIALMAMLTGGWLTGRYYFGSDNSGSGTLTDAQLQTGKVHASEVADVQQEGKHIRQIPAGRSDKNISGDDLANTKLNTRNSNSHSQAIVQIEEAQMAGSGQTAGSDRPTVPDKVAANADKHTLPVNDTQPSNADSGEGEDDDLRSRDITAGGESDIKPAEIDETGIEDRNTGHGMREGGLSMDPVFVKLTSSPVFMHPSFAGSADKSRLTAAYRNQMPSFPGNLVTYYLSFDTYISALHSGVAIVSYYNDALQGMVNSWYNGFVISPKIRIRENISVEPAIQLGYLAMRVDEVKLSELNNTDPNYGYTYDASMNSSGSLDNSHLLDLSGGLLLQWSKFYGGFSIEHITQAMKDPTDAAFIPRRYSAQGGVSLKRYRNSDFTCSPNIQFDMQYKTTTLLWSSAFSYKSLIWGVGFGNQDRFVVMLGLQKNKFRFGYNFDSQLAKLGSNAASAHELSLRYYFSKKDQNGSGKTDDVVTLLR